MEFKLKVSSSDGIRSSYKTAFVYFADPYSSSWSSNSEWISYCGIELNNDAMFEDTKTLDFLTYKNFTFSCPNIFTNQTIIW